MWCVFFGVWGEIGKDLFDDKACGGVLDGKTYLLIQLIWDFGGCEPTNWLGSRDNHTWRISHVIGAMLRKLETHINVNWAITKPQNITNCVSENMFLPQNASSCNFHREKWWQTCGSTINLFIQNWGIQWSMRRPPRQPWHRVAGFALDFSQFFQMETVESWGTVMCNRGWLKPCWNPINNG